MPDAVAPVFVPAMDAVQLHLMAAENADTPPMGILAELLRSRGIFHWQLVDSDERCAVCGGYHEGEP